ncbi:MAG: biotin transporter BioY [Alphaproteobacteria bacterium]
MSISGPLQSTLAAALWPTGKGSAALRAIILMVAGSALLALSAQVRVPLEPVPITMQTFAVLVIGMAYGWRLGAATVLLYLAEGAVGLPVFAGGAGGLAVLIGKTGGYLIGFALAATLVGWLAEHGWDRTIATTALAMLAGNVAIYLPGLLVLGALIGYAKAVEFGLLPFLLGDALKLLLAAAVLPFAWRLIGRPRT